MEAAERGRKGSGEAKEGLCGGYTVRDGLVSCVNGLLGGCNGGAGWRCCQGGWAGVLWELKEKHDGEHGGVMEAVVNQVRSEEGGDAEVSDVGCASGR